MIIFNIYEIRIVLNSCRELIIIIIIFLISYSLSKVNSLHNFLIESSQQPHESDTINVPILQLREIRLRFLAQLVSDEIRMIFFITAGCVKMTSAFSSRLQFTLILNQISHFQIKVLKYERVVTLCPLEENICQMTHQQQDKL